MDDIFSYLYKFDTRYIMFLSARTPFDENAIHEMFEKTASVFREMGVQKLELANEFVRDMGLYNRGDALTHEYFSDIEKRYLLLSDLYDFLRLKRLISE